MNNHVGGLIILGAAALRVLLLIYPRTRSKGKFVPVAVLSVILAVVLGVALLLT
jgi:hypothetical protein